MFRCCSFILIGSLVLLASAATSHAQKKHAAEEKGARSVNNDVETSMTFFNQGSTTVKIHWLDDKGKRVPIQTLTAGQRYTVTKTYLTHPWLVTDEQDNALGVYYPDAQPRSVAIGTPSSASSGFGGRGAPLAGGFVGWSTTSTSGTLQYLQDAQVRADLKLDKAQATQLEDIGKQDAEKRRAVGGPAGGGPAGGGPPGGGPRMSAADVTRETDAAISKLLTAAQNTRLQQIIRQQSGTRIFSDAVLLEALKPTAEQTGQLQTARMEYSDRSREISRVSGTLTEEYKKKVAELRKEIYAKVVAMLTPEQKVKWNELVGEPFAGYVAPGFTSTFTARDTTTPPPLDLRALSYSFNNWSTGSPRFIHDKRVQEELKLTPEQVRKVAEISNRGATDALNSVLTPAQMQRYRGIYLQQLMVTYGPAGAFRYREVLDALSLSEEQKARVLAIGLADSQALAALRQADRSFPPDKVKEIDRATEAKLAEVLDKDQQAKLKAFLGESFQLQPTVPTPSRGDTRSSTRGGGTSRR